jgi:hypothetical protein
MTWICADCGYEDEERWLMCPECTTPEDWAEARAAIAEMEEPA